MSLKNIFKIFQKKEKRSKFERYMPIDINTSKKNVISSIKKPTKTSFFVGHSIYKTSKYNHSAFIVGPPGAGKTLTFFKPNISNEKEASLFVLDYRQELLSYCEKSLEKNGYQIVNIDFDNIANNKFNQKKIYIETNEELTFILNKLFLVEDEDDLYENIEVYLFRCIAKIILRELGFINKEEISNYFLEKTFNEIKKDLDFTDKYIKENFDEFSYFFKDFDENDYNELKERLLKKHEFLNNKINKLSYLEINEFLDKNNFSILRKEKIAIFFQLDTFSSIRIENIVKPYINQIFNQLIDNKEGLHTKFFMDNTESLKEIDNLESLVSLSRGKNYSLFLGFQQMSNIESIYKEKFFPIIMNMEQLLVYNPTFKDTSILNELYDAKINHNNLMFEPRYHYLLIQRNEKNNLFDIDLKETPLKEMIKDFYDT